MSEETKAVVTLEGKVANYKLVARDALRMELISPRLTKIAELESQVKKYSDCVKHYEHTILVENYEISKLDKEHPDYEDTKKNKEDEVKYSTERIEDCKKSIVEIEKEIAYQKESIAKIEKGETLVSLERLNDLVAKMVRQDALNQVAA